MSPMNFKIKKIRQIVVMVMSQILLLLAQVGNNLHRFIVGLMEVLSYTYGVSTFTYWFMPMALFRVFKVQNKGQFATS